MTGCSNWRSILISACIAGVAAPAGALDRVRFDVQGADAKTAALIKGVSLLAPYARGSDLPAQDFIAKARAEYAALLDALYGQGYFGAQISVLVDGREAAEISPLDPPQSISRIDVLVETGPAFVFGRAMIEPIHGASQAPIADVFAAGKPAKSGAIVDAASIAIDGWRARGFAKAKVVQSELTADHDRQILDAYVQLDKGPRLVFGDLKIDGAKSMRRDRILAIAGLPEGEVFDPIELGRVAERLRRTGAFRAVNIQESDKITDDNRLPITAVLTEERLRRLAFRADLASLEGASVGVVGAHRNLLGGAERLTLAASAMRIGVDTGGLDYQLSASFERPATFSPDTTFALGLVFEREQTEDTQLDALSINAELTQYFSKTLTGDASLTYAIARADDPSGVAIYRSLSVPFAATWDTRNAKESANDGVLVSAEIKPFLGFGQTENGVRSTMDARGYLGVNRSNNLVMAARVQMGMFMGSSLAGSPREDLFYSGGPATVRGQPYQSLGVFELVGNDGNTFQTGGTHFLAGSLEVRQKINDSIGLIGFADIGRVDSGGFLANAGNWHAGAGVGLRYQTAIGPLRLDLAGPVGGDTGQGGQLYLGLGQAF